MVESSQARVKRLIAEGKIRVATLNTKGWGDKNSESQGDQIHRAFFPKEIHDMAWRIITKKIPRWRDWYLLLTKQRIRCSWCGLLISPHAFAGLCQECWRAGRVQEEKIRYQHRALCALETAKELVPAKSEIYAHLVKCQWTVFESFQEQKDYAEKYSLPKDFFSVCYVDDVRAERPFGTIV